MLEGDDVKGARSDAVREHAEFLQNSVTLWVGDRRLAEAMRAEELGQLEGLERVLTIRNGGVALSISYVRHNPRADSSVAVLLLIAFLCDNNHGLCRVGAKRMGEVLLRSERNVRDTIDRLEEQNLIGVLRPKAENPKESSGTHELAYWVKIPREIPTTPVSTMEFVRQLASAPYRSGAESTGSRHPVPPKAPDVDVRSNPEKHRMSTSGALAHARSLGNNNIIINNINNLPSGEDRGCGGKEPPLSSEAPAPALTSFEEATPVVKAKGSRAAPRFPMPQGWTPGPAGAEYAYRRGMTREDAAAEWATFQNFHQSKGSVMADWSAAWRTWCDKAASYRRGGKNSAPSSMDIAAEALRRKREGGR